MADTLCGPSNALQSFQKHTSVDRTLQQDRLISRQSPSQQGFRSTSGLNRGLLDPEFEAFQAGVSPSFQNFAQLPHPAHPTFFPPPGISQSHVFAQPLAGAGWATDFQNLQICPPGPVERQHQPLPQSASSWHDEFQAHHSPAHMQQLQPLQPQYQQPAFNSAQLPFRPYNYMSPGAQHQHQPQEYSSESRWKGKWRQPSETPADTLAFDRAFEAHATVHQEPRQQEPQRETVALAPDEMASLHRARERPLSTRELQAYDESLHGYESGVLDLGDMASERTLAGQVERLGSDSSLEARRLQERAEALLQRSRNVPLEADIAQRERFLQENMSARHEQEALFYEPQEPVYEPQDPVYQPQDHEPEQQQQQQQQQQQPHETDEDLARTAGQLLANLADNATPKFRESSFLSLMRRLRDREVHVRGDKMVDVGRGSEVEDAAGREDFVSAM